MLPRYPACASEVTCERLAASLAVAAHWHASQGSDTAAAALDGLAFVLRTLVQVAPDRADEIALSVWHRTQDAPPEGWTTTALAELGVCPEAVYQAARGGAAA
ncbi:hypothetical protein [Microbispora sp. ATCC PTA-5024]|uniref:hypothetical protein n=1 Tax=Microbispora sp. ATCC PTA-5024 TaxID=316330 RepID=UPI0003DCA44A|nr:hypothetical protein [Microbispora sp. ATCC PTA-5024]ETK36165.1 hypothetical protein MPTA5024_11100 [Microbispora sp. ATCC PTA-5024]